MKIQAGMKIVATNTHYPNNVPNGTIMTVVSDWGEGHAHASVDGQDVPAWFMPAGTYEPYIVKSDDTAPADDTPVFWRDMTPAEKGALLLAHHEGRAVQRWADGNWHRKIHDGWSNSVAYRVKPEPTVETVTLYGRHDVQWVFCQSAMDTHRITFNLIDGKPDPASIRMEEL